jgi:hypothetical protein
VVSSSPDLRWLPTAPMTARRWREFSIIVGRPGATHLTE